MNVIVVQQGISNALVKVRPASDSTDLIYPTRIPTSTLPLPDANNGLVQFANKDGAPTPNSIKVIPIGSGPINAGFKIKILGWDTDGTQYIPTVLAELDCQLASGIVGTGGLAGPAYQFCDGINIVTAPFIESLATGDGEESMQNTSNIGVWKMDANPAYAVVGLCGCRVIAFLFSMTGGSTGFQASSANALIKGM